MIRVAIVGAAGRMGRILVSQVLKDPELSLSGALEYSGCPLLGQDAGTVAGEGACGVKICCDIEKVLAESDAAIDFTSPEATMHFAAKAAAAGVHLVIGTTGLSVEQKKSLQELSCNGARIVCAPNMSIGINLLFSLCAKVAPILDDYDIEVVEMDHNKKKDAPSGTAERLGESWRKHVAWIIHGYTAWPGGAGRCPYKKKKLACTLCAVGMSSGITRSFSQRGENAWS